MVVQREYKQTDIGLIPVEWEIDTVGSLTEVTAGGTPSTFIREYWNGKIRWMNSGELNLKKVFDTENRITELGLKSSATKLIPVNCVLIGLAGQGKTRGTVAINKVELCTNQSIAAIYPSDAINSEYLYHNLDSRYHELRGLSIGDGGRGGLNLSILKKLFIPLPSLQEQNAIAQALSDMDVLIAQTEKLIEKKKAIKQGMMQELLKPKEGWITKRLGECICGSPDYGINASAVEYADTLPKYIRITDISEDGKFLQNGKVSVNNPRAGSFFLQENDFVFARTGASVGKTYLYNKEDGELVFAGFLIRVKPNIKLLDPEYLRQFTLTKRYKNWVTIMSMRSGQPGINGNEFKQLPIPLPSTLEEQKRISRILYNMDEEITLIENKVSKYRNIKEGIMQVLLTGRIRLV